MKQRVITAIIMIAVGLPILIYGKLPFIILGLLLALVATQEMIDMKETVAKTPIEVKLFTMLATLMIMFSSFNFKTLSFTGTLTFGLGTMALFLFILLFPCFLKFPLMFSISNFPDQVSLDSSSSHVRGGSSLSDKIFFSVNLRYIRMTVGISNSASFNASSS